jgi:nitric oxide dioxygenase
MVVSTLNFPRGSDGMNLPESLSEKTLDIVSATASVVSDAALDITKNFYHRMLGNHPELLAFFNPAHNMPISLEQPQALASSIQLYASNIRDLSPLLVPGGPLAAICHRHCALAVEPNQYTVVYENLMAAIVDVLGSDAVTADVAAAWSEAVLFLAKVCIDTEESLYQMLEQRRGGWSGFIDFQVTDIDDTVATNVKKFTFQPAPGSRLEGQEHFDFTAGQYLSLKVDPDQDGLTAPRHFTVTSPPGANYLQCIVKRIDKGKVTKYLHDTLKVGDIVQLSAPLGVYTANADDEQAESAVLVSAGIGVTPMINLKRTLGDKVKIVVHVDRTPEHYPCRQFFAENDTNHIKTMEKYTQANGRIGPKDLAHEMIDTVGTNHTFYVFGPSVWMKDLQQALLDLGASKVMCEVFGSQIGSGCPFHATSANK